MTKKKYLVELKNKNSRAHENIEIEASNKENAGWIVESLLDDTGSYFTKGRIFEAKDWKVNTSKTLVLS